MANLDDKEAFLREVEDPNFDRVEEILDPEILLPWMGIQSPEMLSTSRKSGCRDYNQWVSTIHQKYWSIEGFHSYSVHSSRYPDISYRHLVNYLVSHPSIFGSDASTFGVQPRVVRLCDALLKNATTPSSFLFSEPVLQRYWPEVAKHPMVPLWVETSDYAVLDGLVLYFTKMQSTVSDSDIRNDSHTPLLYELIKDLPRLDMRFVALVDEFVREVFPGSMPLPKLTKNTQKAKAVFSAEMAIFFEKEKNRVVNAFTADETYGLLMWRPAPRKPVDINLDVKLVENFCVYAFQNLVGNNKRESVLNASMSYLRWLRKVAELAGKPMPEHLLSEVTHG